MSDAVNHPMPHAKSFRGLWSFLARNYLNVFSAGLLLAALFYFLQIQIIRDATLANHPELFSDGERVTVNRVIDGDEVRVRNSRGSTRVRILGIKSFEASERDLMLAEYGKVAVDFLESEVVGKKVRIQLAEKRVDDEGRLLASLFLIGDEDQDVAKSMVASGLTLVFTRHPFPQMDDYLKSQDIAKSESLGFWQSQRVAARAESMLEMWNQERSDR